MKIFYLTLLVTTFSLAASAQILPSTKIKKKTIGIDAFRKQQQLRTAIPFPASNLRTAATCTYDTVDYLYYKMNNINFLDLINTSGQALLIGQYFPCPQPITISGFYFIAIKPDTVDVSPVNVTCNLYNATADSSVLVKLGSSLDVPLASVIVSVDTVGYSNVFRGLRKAVFSKPVTVSKPFILSITNPSAVDDVVLVTSNFSDSANGQPRQPDGHEEWLMTLTLRNSATSIASHNSRYYGIDGDLQLYPFINYDLTADFSVDKDTVAVAEDISFTNLSSPILRSKIYNLAPGYNQDSLSYYWNFGDSTAGVANIRNIADQSFTKHYNAEGTYTVTLVDSMYGYYRNCGALKTKNIVVSGIQAVDKAHEGKNMKLFPNPSEGDFMLSFDGTTNENYQLMVSDLTGTEVFKSQISSMAETRLSLKNYPKGMYLLKLVNDKEIIIRQLIVR